jgi:hypothetical protein
VAASRSTLLIGLALLVTGCAGASASASRRPLPPPTGDGRAGAREARGAGPALAPDVQKAVDTAQSLVGQRAVVVGGRDYGSGCAALVRAAYDRAGHPLPSDARDAASLFSVARSRGSLREGIRSSPGDLIFLADRPGGPPAHVGLVAHVDPDGTALVLHRVARGVARLHVNLGYPSKVSDPATGRRLNDTLVVGSTAQPAGSLVVGVAGLL